MLYQFFLSLWRFLALCYYAEVRLEVLKLTKHMEDGTIKARWRVKGLPFHSVLLRFYYKDKSQLYRYRAASSQFDMFVFQTNATWLHKGFTNATRMLHKCYTNATNLLDGLRSHSS